MIKPLAGVLLLAAVLWWALHQDFLLAGVGWREFAAAVAISIVIVCLNAEILIVSLRSLDVAIPRRDALWLTGIGGLGNSLGGLPIGTGVKFALLVRRYGMTVRAVFWVYIFYSVVNAVWMMLFGAVLAGLSGSAPLRMWAVLMSLPFVVLALLIACLRGKADAMPWLPVTVTTLARSPHFVRGAATSALNVLMMLACFGVLLSAHADFQLAVGALLSVCIAVPVGFLTGLPSLGGMQELLLGAAGTWFDQSVAHGVQLGLLARAASLLASSLVLVQALLRGGRMPASP